MRIDLVSDVACPWCAIGMSALERALDRIGGDSAPSSCICSRSS